jgi:cytoskeletal protein CcmA (bactofilin family)
VSLWKNLRSSAEESERPGEAPSAVPAAAQARATAPERTAFAERRPAVAQGGRALANIGKSISIQGDVVGDEDTVIEGRVEGSVALKNHHLTIGPNGDVAGEVSAKQVTIVGRVTGNVSATERVEISDSGRLSGDVVAPRLLLHEGAQLNGNVAMRPPQAQIATPIQKKLDEPRKAEARSASPSAPHAPQAHV